MQKCFEEGEKLIFMLIGGIARQIGSLISTGCLHETNLGPRPDFDEYNSFIVKLLCNFIA